MNYKTKRLLCVDDNKDNLDLIKFIFEQEGYEVISCDLLEDCLTEIRCRDFEAVILDNRFGEKTSLEACREIRLFKPLLPIIFYSGEVRQEKIDQALAAGADAYLTKPNDFSELISTTARLIVNRYNSEKERCAG